MTALALIEEKREQIHALCLRYGVKRLRLFGSAVGGDWNPESSDFDFAAEFGEPPIGVNLFEQQFGLLADLESLLGRSVDVVEWRMAQRPGLRFAIESSGREIYAA